MVPLARCIVGKKTVIKNIFVSYFNNFSGAKVVISCDIRKCKIYFWHFIFVYMQNLLYLCKKYRPMNFTHLHVHSHYSVLDGMSKVPDLVDKCLRTGMHAMALTDHGNMYGIKELLDYSKKTNTSKVFA